MTITKTCPKCGGDGLDVAGWCPDAFENIERRCPKCYGKGNVSIIPTPDQIEQLWQIVVISYRVAERLGMGVAHEDLPEDLQALDWHLANELDDDLWEALVEATGNRVTEASDDSE